MSMNRELQNYGTQQVMTSDPVTLVALLYDKTVLSLKAAIQAIHEKDVDARWKNTNKAVEIINHLFMTLDLEKGGDIASNLEALYEYMLRRLVDVDTNNDARAAEEVIQLLEPLRASWKELARNSGDFKNEGAPGIDVIDVSTQAEVKPQPRAATPRANEPEQPETPITSISLSA